jgi:predicted 3-demethylubiquinone-9 3-methyltransferase (glyoxalase superfamily)
MNFYVSIFKNSKVLSVSHYEENAPMLKGTVMTANFELDGQTFTALNGGPMFKFSPAISFVVHCETQAEVDHYWAKLSAGGKEGQCAWLEDKFGVSWQVVLAGCPQCPYRIIGQPRPCKSWTGDEGHDANDENRYLGLATRLRTTITVHIITFKIETH